jgi:hypothetical protein
MCIPRFIVEPLEDRRLLAVAPTLSIYARIAAASETSPTSSGMGQFIVRLSEPASQAVTVQYSIGSTSTARAGVDFEAVTGAVRIPQGRSYSYVRIYPIDDRIVEQDERVVVVLRPLSGLRLAHQKALVTIGDDDSTLYVSPVGNDNNPGTEAAPLKTLHKARDVVRLLTPDMTGDITVMLRGGAYELSSTLGLDQRDSGLNGYRVMWRAYGNEKPIITGGTRIFGWTREPGGTFSAPTNGKRFLQMYVDGKRATLARTPNAGSFHTMSWNEAARTISIDPSDAAVLHTLSTQELQQVRITIPGRGTNQATLRIASISGNVSVPLEPERELIVLQ